jgi:hypothetical protein
LSFEDEQDASKYMIYNLPSGPGNTTVAFYVRSKSENFFPKLYWSLGRQNTSEVTFPPDELITYSLEQAWDMDMYALKASVQYSNLPEGSFIALNLMYNKIRRGYFNSTQNQSEHSAKQGAGHALITVSHTKITVLAEGEDYHGTLAHGAFYRFQLFRVFNPNKNLTKITFSQCVGASKFSLVRNPGDLITRLPLAISEERGQKVGTIRGVAGEAYILVEAFTDDLESDHEYILRVDFLEREVLGFANSLYMPMEDGRIEFEYMRGRKGNVLLRWKPLYSLDAMSNKEVPGVRYKLLFSENPEAVMDSVCAIKLGAQLNSDVFTVYEQVDGSNEYVTTLPRGHEIQFNVIAVVEST